MTISKRRLFTQIECCKCFMVVCYASELTRSIPPMFCHECMLAERERDKKLAPSKDAVEFEPRDED